MNVLQHCTLKCFAAAGGKRTRVTLNVFFPPLTLTFRSDFLTVPLSAVSWVFIPPYILMCAATSVTPGIEVTLSKSKWLFIHAFSREIVYPCGMCALHLHLIPGQNFIRSFASYKKKKENAEQAKCLLPGTPHGMFPTSFGFISCIFLIRQHRERVWRGKVIEQTFCLSHSGRLNRICYC